MKSIFLIMSLSVLSINASYAGQMVLGDEQSIYIPTEQDFDNIARANEYLAAKTKFIRAQKEVLTEQNEVDGKGGVTDSSFGTAPAMGVPRALRGSGSGDVLIDSKGNRIQEVQEPTTYISCISGSRGNYVAELVWAEQIITVKKGDPLIGGNWEVVAINQDSIDIANEGRRLRIGKLPVKVRSITGE